MATLWQGKMGQGGNRCTLVTRSNLCTLTQGFLVRGKQTSKAACSPYGASKGEMLNMFLNKWHLHYLFITRMLTEK